MKRYNGYSTIDEIAEIKERRKYGGRTREEIRKEVECLNEMVFGLAGSGDINEIYEIIIDDPGMLTFFDEIAQERERVRASELGETIYLQEGSNYHKIERVKEMFENR